MKWLSPNKGEPPSLINESKVTMDPALQAFMTGLPVFLLHGSIALAIWIGGVGLYLAITPHDEVALVRDGNVAAGLSLGAAAIGVAIPIAATLASSHSLIDLGVWGLTALTLQLVVFRGVDLLVKDLAARITRGEMAPAVVLVGVKLGAALITAAALLG
jgi:putative membrane protein